MPTRSKNRPCGCRHGAARPAWLSGATDCRCLPQHSRTAISCSHTSRACARQENPLDELSAGLAKLSEKEAFSVHKRVKFSFTKHASPSFDAPLLYRLRTALVQLVRNAVHHGIELPAERVRAGKPEDGQIRIELGLSHGQLWVSCTDDGRGIDGTKVAARAVETGLMPAMDVAKLDRHAQLRLILRPGLSTEDEVHLGAGRGLGMTVVSDAMESLRGTIEIHSEKGVGTEFRLAMPAESSGHERKADQGGYDEHLGGR
jgi:chemotaxis protein histidine kinase CheA